jgi:processive 1,2-diacylglycerol beta-glucosyltransferase
MKIRVLSCIGLGLLLSILTSCRKSIKKEPVEPVRNSIFIPDIPLDTHKKRVIIFSSKGGGGHTSASNAIKDYLGDAYHVAIVNVFTDEIVALDPIHNLTTGAYGGEKFYDFFLQTQSIWCAQAWCAFGRVTMRLRSSSVEASFEECIKTQKPDLIISVIPVIDGSLYRVAERLDIPLAVITCDLDATNYINGLRNVTYEKFFFGLNFDDPKILETIKPAQIPPNQVRFVGFPVRTAFLHKPHTSCLKQELAIPTNKPVVMVLMGSAGSKATFSYARALAKFKKPIHIILCLGRNEALREKIATIPFPAHISVTVVGFTNRIADYMGVSDLLITKSGPTSICEALNMGLPMIIDHTKRVLWWEQMNIDFVRQHGFGQELRSMRNLSKLLELSLESSVLESMREAMRHYHLPDVKNNVKALVDEMAALCPSTAPENMPIVESALAAK